MASVPRRRSEQRGRRECRRGNAALIAETFRDQWAELIYRLTRVRSLGHENDFVAFAVSNAIKDVTLRALAERSPS